MKKLTLLTFISAFILMAMITNAGAQSVQVRAENLIFESANSISFDCYIKNTGGADWQYSNAIYSWTYNTSVLNGGTITWSMVDGSSDLGGSAPTATYTSGDVIRTTESDPGAGPFLAPNSTLKVAKFRLQTSAASFASFNHAITFQQDITKIYFWNGAGSTEFIGTNKTYSDIIDIPLPVELASFTANITNTRGVTLNWRTAKETNNKGFEIERKNIDGIWAKVGYMDGKGTTNTETSYKFDDKKLNSGKYNYRLKQVDYNGNFAYHNLTGTIEVGLPTSLDLSQNYPNPFNPTTKIDFQLPSDGKVTILIYDMTGREVQKLLNNELRSAGYHTIDFNGSKIASGAYFYRIIAESNAKLNVMTKKMLMIK